MAETSDILFFPDDRKVTFEAGMTLLEASLKADIPHANACRGKGRCSTCRVRILAGGEALGPRSKAEEDMARRLQFDEGIRLACQCPVQAGLKVRRLVLDEEDMALTSQLSSPEPKGQQGGESIRETDLAILFSDLRGFTSFAEKLLPYDVIHVLNRHFLTMGRVIEEQSGWIDNTMGDGLLALFPGDSPQEACARAVTAGLNMLQANCANQAYLQNLFGETLDLGVGIHFGTVVRGPLGFGKGRRNTVIGDAVNLASRIESANKEAGTRLLVSETVLGHLQNGAGTRCRQGRTVELGLKGKSGCFSLVEILPAEGG